MNRNLTTAFSCVFFTFYSVGFTSAQELELRDPTAESEIVQNKLDELRGIKKLPELERRLKQLTQAQTQLKEQLNESKAKNEMLQTQVDQLQLQRQNADLQRQAVPELRLIAQVRTPFSSIAEIEAGERIYRVDSDKQFPLVLNNGQTIQAQVRFLPRGPVEVAISELDVTFLLSYRPRTP